MDKTFDDLFNEFLKRNKETMGGDPISAFKNEAKCSGCELDGCGGG